MKKKVILAGIILIILVLLCCLGFFKYKDYKKTKENKMYEEIISDFEKAIIWELDVTNLSAEKCEENISKSVLLTSKYLNSQGYL